MTMTREEQSLRVIISPHLSEKAALATQNKNEYVFEVARSANKVEVKIAVEYLFKVNVEQVRVVNVKAKPRRFGQIMGTKKAWKKAYVTLKDGQSIDLTGSNKA